jgi:hypothetical protein
MEAPSFVSPPLTATFACGGAESRTERRWRPYYLKTQPSAHQVLASRLSGPRLLAGTVATGTTTYARLPPAAAARQSLDVASRAERRTNRQFRSANDDRVHWRRWGSMASSRAARPHQGRAPLPPRVGEEHSRQPIKWPGLPLPRQRRRYASRSAMIGSRHAALSAGTTAARMTSGIAARRTPA